MKRHLFFLSIILFITACDPGHTGRVFISNASSEPVVLTFQSRYTDTMITIPAKSITEVYHFGGLGEGREYSSCLQEFSSITIFPADSAKHITKDIRNANNWITGNENKHRYSNKEIRCEYRITPADIQ